MLQNDFMKKLQMVDLQTQYEFIKDQVDSSVLEIFKRGTFINGPSVKEFQTELEEYLKLCDRQRNNSFSATFPEMKDIFDVK